MRAPSAHRGRVRAGAWVAGAAFSVVFALVAWPFIVGGVLHGNPRSAAFGVGLATVSGVALGGLATLVRRLGRSS